MIFSWFMGLFLVIFSVGFAGYLFIFFFIVFGWVFLELFHWFSYD